MLIERRIPVVSAATRELLNTYLVWFLGMQMAAGHVGNTLLIARVMNLAFRPYIRLRRFPISYLYFTAMFRCRRYDRIVKEVPHEAEFPQHYLNHIVGVAHLYAGDIDIAEYFLKRAISLNDQHVHDFRVLGRCCLWQGRLPEAARYFERAVELAPNTVMAHQNYAGRYDIPNYVPKDWELAEAGRLLIYDNYGQLAEDFFLLGRFNESFELYQRMCDYQALLRDELPRALVDQLAALNRAFDRSKPIRLLPYEWVTQFGHIGLLDSYIKMARLGMYPAANYVLLAPEAKVSNEVFLAYWESYFTIVRDDDLVLELFPYQRMLGDNFMARPGDAGIAEPWTRAAARAQIAWAEQNRPPLLSVTTDDQDNGQRMLAALGIPDGAWYVGLHVREATYYQETAGGMSEHRNAAIEDYIPAIKAITARGGYVIRLGDSTMRPLPEMPGVVDYALSDRKSAQMDIFLCATCRFIIGTTSGLTTASLSFGTSMLLVNCISNDWQLWSDKTDFIVKPVWDVREKRPLTFAETYRQPVQGYLINAQVMERRGIEARPNTPDEISEAVEEKLDSMDGRRPPDDEGELMASYRASMADNPMMFGAARPAMSFLRRNPEMLTPVAQKQDAIL